MTILTHQCAKVFISLAVPALFLCCNPAFAVNKHFAFKPKCSFSYSSYNDNSGYWNKTLYLPIPYPCEFRKTTDTKKIYARKIDHLTVFLIGSDVGVSGLLFNEEKFEFAVPTFKNSMNRTHTEQGVKEGFDRKFFTHFFNSEFAKHGFDQFKSDEYIFIDDFDKFLEEKYAVFHEENYKYRKMRPKPKPSVE